MKRLFVCVFGNPDSGKTSTAKFLADSYEFSTIKPSDLVRQYAQANELPLLERRDHLQAYLRMIAEHGPDYVADRVLSVPTNRVCVDGERIPSNVDRLRKLVGAKVVGLALWCPIEIRYARSLERGEERDKQTFEAFARDEAEEYQSPRPPYASVITTMQTADFHIDASGSKSKTLQDVSKVIEPLL